MARNVMDTALMLQAMAGPDRHDSTAALVDVPIIWPAWKKASRGCASVSRRNISASRIPIRNGEYQEQALPAEVEASVRRAADLLADMGAEIVENVPMPNTRYGVPVYFVISRVEAASNLHRYDGVKYGYRTQHPTADLTELYRRTRNEAFGLQPKLRILMGMYVSAAQYSAQYYRRALRVRSLIRRDFEQAFDPQGKYRLNALLTPTTPTTAFKMGAVYGDSVMMQYSDQLNVPANHAGIPGLSLPAGLDQNKMPIGIQLLGPDYSEDVLLRIGRAYEQATETDAWRKIAPLVLR
jgi:aspartyl-tRNA(Asn)/glutamyl-tRNA(Gln) amidotransferase subunit A